MFYGMQINLLFYVTGWLRTKNMLLLRNTGYMSDMFLVETKQNDTCESFGQWLVA
jgi:hypothetical protein